MSCTNQDNVAHKEQFFRHRQEFDSQTQGSMAELQTMRDKMSYMQGVKEFRFHLGGRCRTARAMRANPRESDRRRNGE